MNIIMVTVTPGDLGMIKINMDKSIRGLPGQTVIRPLLLTSTKETSHWKRQGTACPAVANQSDAYTRCSAAGRVLMVSWD